MTNGEKMQEMFPEGKTRSCRGGVVFESDGWCHAYHSGWWNAEYKEPVIRDNGVKNELEPTTKNDLAVKCIDEAEFIEKLENATTIGLLPWQRAIIYQAMDECKPATPQPRWIPVSERMPEENRTVIASTKYGVYPEARYTKEDGWEWAYESGADYWEEIGCNVLAWMPLPEPYKAKRRIRNDKGESFNIGTKDS